MNYTKNAYTLAEVFSPHPIRRFGFTLAEVLITLGIIGVVAALTMGIIIPNIEKQRNLAVLKKSYSEMQNYVKDFEQDAGCYDIKTCWSEQDEFMNTFASYLIEKKKFQPFVSFDRANNVLLMYSAFNRKTAIGGYSYIRKGLGYTDGKIDEHNTSDIPLISPSGSFMVVIGINAGDFVYAIKGNYFRAKVNILVNNKRFGMKDGWSFSQLEQNLNKFPRAGKDLFQFFIMNDGKVIPNGSKECNPAQYSCLDWEAFDTCNPENIDTSGKSGTGCLSRIIEDGWQIKYKW